MPVVLTLEDDEQVRVLAESILQDSGHETLSATNVDEALALLRSDQTIDVLLPISNCGMLSKVVLIWRRKVCAYALRSTLFIPLAGT